jgi:hypothetical protein
MARFRPNIVVGNGERELEGGGGGGGGGGNSGGARLAPWEEYHIVSWRVGAAELAEDAAGAQPLSPPPPPPPPLVLRHVKRCARCLVTTTDQETGARGSGDAALREPLATLRTFRASASGDVFFGANLVVCGLGALASAPRERRLVRVGDPVAVLSRGRVGPF